MSLLKIVDAHSFFNFSGDSLEKDRDLAATVSKIISRVREAGDQALLEYTREFDGIELESLQIQPEVIEKAYDQLDKKTRRILDSAISNIREFHAFQKQTSWSREYADGTVLGEQVTALDRVGIYVPGGKAFYPSTLIMNAIPAQIAGVPSITIVSPPGPDRLPHKLVLAICSLLGLTSILAVGGAQAIAALAYGTQTIQPVCKITGPGNRFVAEAKRQVFGKVGIDSIAGPSEIVILHDDPAIPVEFLVRDLLTQAEHDEDASAVLITTIPEMAETVSQRIEEILPNLPRKDIIAKSLKSNGALVVVDKLSEGIELVNKIAPEHLELMVQDKSVVSSIANAGAIFVGKWSSETVGDYFAGPNHTIPTSGAAKYSSPLSVRDFQKHSSVIEYSEARLKKEASQIAEFADLEGLTAHADAIRIRQQ